MVPRYIGTWRTLRQMCWHDACFLQAMLLHLVHNTFSNCICCSRCMNLLFSSSLFFNDLSCYLSGRGVVSAPREGGVKEQTLYAGDWKGAAELPIRQKGFFILLLKRFAVAWVLLDFCSSLGRDAPTFSLSFCLKLIPELYSWQIRLKSSCSLAQLY